MRKKKSAFMLVSVVLIFLIFSVSFGLVYIYRRIDADSSLPPVDSDAVDGDAVVEQQGIIDIEYAFSPVSSDAVSSDGADTVFVGIVPDGISGLIETALGFAETQPVFPVEDRKTIYATEFGHPTYAWCTEFALWCYNAADNALGTDNKWEIYPWYDYSGGCVSWFSREGRLKMSKNGYVPSRGDFVFFCCETSYGDTDHTGLVTGSFERDGVIYIETIEGNIPGDSPKCVRCRVLPVTDSSIYAFGIVRK